jgi:NADH-quinone oxidoreductase subunit M
METGTLATFATLDLILFFLAFETVLIPMYFLIARWGGEQRGRAAWKFILYTLLGSAVMLLGLLLIGVKGGTFDMVALAAGDHAGLTRTTQIIAVLAIGVGPRCGRCTVGSPTRTPRRRPWAPCCWRACC